MRPFITGATLAITIIASSFAPAHADETTRISNAPNGHAGDAGAWVVTSISADGNAILFTSYADDLVAGDTNHAPDVFVFDRTTSVLERISVSSSGVQGNDSSWGGWANCLSSDGRYAVFASAASNLAVDPNGHRQDIFLRDRLAGTTTLISMDPQQAGANGDCEFAVISRDGQKIAFDSYASNLVSNDVNGYEDVFVWDAATQTIALASVDGSGTQGNGHSGYPVLAGDGNVVGFTSEAGNFPGGGDDCTLSAAYVKDLTTYALERVDVDTTGLIYGTDWNSPDALSLDGRFVLFTSATALVPDDGNDRFDAYLRDRVAGTTERVSIATDGSGGSNDSIGNSISADGRYVAFSSYSLLVDNKTNWSQDVFVRDRDHRTTMRVSVGTYDEQGDNIAQDGSISDDGKFVAFVSAATNLVPNDNGYPFNDVFLRERSLTPASWTNYGSGFPGRNGVVPSLTAREKPWRSATIDVDIGNSSNFYIVAFLLIGFARDDIPTEFGGTLLLDADVAIPIPLIPSGGTYTSQTPADWWADGLVVDLQVLELDPWAAKGVSFTPGLELVLGDG